MHGAERVSDSLQAYGPPFPDAWRDAQTYVTEQCAQWAHKLGWAQPPAPPPPPAPSAIPPRMPFTRTAAFTLGGALAVGLGIALAPRLGRLFALAMTQRRGILASDGSRTQCVVILGGDTRLGRALVRHALSRDLIVLVSVASRDAAARLEHDCMRPQDAGYVRTLILDPASASEHDMTHFVHAVHASLSMRFPCTSSGDPYARPGAAVELVGMINTLSYVPEVGTPNARNDARMADVAPSNLDTALHTHVTAPLAILSRLASLLMQSHSHVPCVPALVMNVVSLPGARIALPSHGTAALVAQAAQTGFTSLRRESEQAWAASRLPPSCRVQWTTIQVAPHAKHLDNPTKVVSKAVSLLLGTRTYVWLTYTVSGGTLAHGILARCVNTLLRLVPASWIDALISAHARCVQRWQHYQHIRRTGSGTHPK